VSESIRASNISSGLLQGVTRLFKGAIAVFLALLVGGCITVSFGTMPQTDRLDKLAIGESRRGDVLLALGQPRGEGAANVSPEFDKRVIWFYEFVESDGQAVKLKMLLVYFVGDVYDGYLWFSSVEDIS
jgi:outer membrane protein assembly factor BamE (lipoprotein component of BamABCDE complex)